MGKARSLNLRHTIEICENIILALDNEDQIYIYGKLIIW